MLSEFPQEQKNVYSVPFLTNEHQEFVMWFFTGSKCNLECTHCYVESGPNADQHPMLTTKTFKRHLSDALAKDFNQLEIYFTGGEPFVNPNLLEMFDESLKHADTTVLTNATRITEAVAKSLRSIQDKRDHKLTFRVSLDGPDQESNDKIRGKRAFERAKRGIENLVSYSFNPIVTTMRSWSPLDYGKKEDQFVDLLVETGIPREEQLLKILPPIRLGRETERSRPYSEEELFTEECFTDYDYNNLQCSKCRMVTERGVWVCPILVNKDSAKMGNTLEDSFEPYAMKDMACWTCRMEGLSCTND